MPGVMAVPSHTSPASAAIDTPMASNVALTTRVVEGARSISDFALERSDVVMDRVRIRDDREKIFASHSRRGVIS